MTWIPDNGAATGLPLADVKVVDLTAARSGPTCVRHLSDWGAQVIQIEAPGSEDSIGVPDSDLQNLHRGKRALTLNLKTEAGHKILCDLVADADVLVENMRPPVKDRLRIDYGTLSEINPRLVYGSISGFGQDGPYANRGGVDQIAQGMAGLMSITGFPGQGPVRVGVAISDLAAGAYLALGILVALHERERSGRGQWVRTSLVESMVAMLDFQATRWTIDGEVPGQDGNHHPSGTVMGCFATADGYVNVAGSGGRLWRALCAALGELQWADDERFDSREKRAENRHEINALVAERMARKTTAEWIEIMTEAGVPAGPVNDIAQTFADPQVQHLKLIEEVHHPVKGALRVVRHPVTMTRTPSRLRSAAPVRGQHTDDILAGLGYAPADIERLREDGVV